MSWRFRITRSKRPSWDPGGPSSWQTITPSHLAEPLSPGHDKGPASSRNAAHPNRSLRTLLDVETSQPRGPHSGQVYHQTFRHSHPQGLHRRNSAHLGIADPVGLLWDSFALKFPSNFYVILLERFANRPCIRCDFSPLNL